jgi:hypothetical protein
MATQEVEAESFSDTWVIISVCSALGYRASYTRGCESSSLERPHEINFLGSLAKLRKGTVSFVTSLYSSAWNNSAANWMDFYEMSYLRIFSKIWRENSSFIKI